MMARPSRAISCGLYIFRTSSYTCMACCWLDVVVRSCLRWTSTAWKKSYPQPRPHFDGDDAEVRKHRPPDTYNLPLCLSSYLNLIFGTLHELTASYVDDVPKRWSLNLLANELPHDSIYSSLM